MLPELLLSLSLAVLPAANELACSCAKSGLEKVVLLTPEKAHDITIDPTPDSASLDEEALDREFSRHDAFAMLHRHPPTSNAFVRREFPEHYAEAYDALSFVNRLHSETDTYTIFGMVYALYQVNPQADIDFYCVSLSDQETVITKYDVNDTLRRELKKIPPLAPEPDDPKVSSLEIAAKMLDAERAMDEAVGKYRKVRADYLQQFYDIPELWKGVRIQGVPDAQELIRRINEETDIRIEVVHPSYK